MEEQRAALLGLGCNLGQGYFFAQALPPADVARMLGAARVLEEQRA
jgi:EAL domain-containing protein (putative c-di-GMP-specific phosphodiesterase class I)